MQLLDHFFLHIQERVPAPDKQLLSPVASCAQRNTQIAGDGMMHRSHQRQPHILDFQHAIAQTLIIVNQVVIMAMLT